MVSRVESAAPPPRRRGNTLRDLRSCTDQGRAATLTLAPECRSRPAGAHTPASGPHREQLSGDARRMQHPQGEREPTRRWPLPRRTAPLAARDPATAGTTMALTQVVTTDRRRTSGRPSPAHGQVLDRCAGRVTHRRPVGQIATSQRARRHPHLPPVFIHAVFHVPGHLPRDVEKAGRDFFAKCG